MLDISDIRSLTDFQRNVKAFVRDLGKTGRPTVLTVKGQAALVVQHAAAYQKLLEAQRKLEDLEAVQLALAQMRSGKTQPFNKVAAALKRRHGQTGKRRRPR